MAVAAKTLDVWKHHLQDEADAAFLYGVLSELELDSTRREIFQRLVQVERRHVDVWRELFWHEGLEVPDVSPTRRARFMAWLARSFGPSMLTRILLREEAAEVKGYLRLHRESGPGASRDTALLLARESAEHAQTLVGLTGSSEEPWHRTKSGGFLRNVIYGFNDGLTANFGLVASVIGADVPGGVVMLTGVAGAVADALSMGASGYLAAKSELEVYRYEIDMERDEIMMMPEVERDELALLYEARGMPRPHAEQMAREMMKDPERALAEKVREELKIGEAHGTPLREGWVTGVATAVGALIPVLPFLFLRGPAAIWISFSVSMLAHFGIGAARTVFTGRSFLRSGLDMFVVGLGVAVVGYFVGEMIAGWI